MKAAAPSQRKQSMKWGSFLRSEHQVLSAIVASTGLLLLVFFVVSVTFPLRNQLLRSLYPKQQASALTDIVVLANSVVSVPIQLQSTENITAIDMDVSVAGGTLDGVTCGGTSFENTPKSQGNKCVIFSPSGAQNGVVATALVHVGASGTLAVNVTGTLSTATGTAPSQGNVYGVVFDIVSALTQNDKLYVPVSFTASNPITAADYTVAVTGGTALQLSCGGSGFREILKNPNNCVVFAVTGALNGVIGSAVVKPTAGSTSLTMTVTCTLSTEGGQAPTTGSCNTITIPVVAASPTVSGGPTPTGVTPSPTSLTPTPTRTVTPTTTIVPTVTATVTPTTTITSTPVPGALTVGRIVSPTYEEVVPVSGTKGAGDSIWLNGEQLVASSASTTWSGTATLQLGANDLFFASKDASDAIKGQVQVLVSRFGVGDINGDGIVNVFDVGIFAGRYNRTDVTDDSPAETRLSDLRKNGIIDVFDLGVLAGKYGKDYIYNTN